MNKKEITPESVMVVWNRDDVQILLGNLWGVSNTQITPNGYTIEINDNLNPDLMMYHLIHQAAHIIKDDINAHPTPRYVQVLCHLDMITLEIYLNWGFSAEIIQNHPHFEKHIQMTEFQQLLNKHINMI